MFTRESGLTTPLHRLAERSFWLMLVMVHVPALIGATRSLLQHADFLHGLSLLALILTVGCFVLKVVGFRFFPQGSPRNRVVIFILIAGLVHHEALATAAENTLANPAPAVLVTTLFIGECVRRSRRHLPSLRNALTALLARPCLERGIPSGDAPFDLFPFRSAFLSRLGIPRAPPA